MNERSEGKVPSPLESPVASGDKKSLSAKYMRLHQPFLARSFRLHRRRGGFCQTGWCNQCKVRLKDGRNVLACQANGVEPSDVIVPTSLLRLVARWFERVPPYFYHKRFIRPRFLRQFYLEVIRRSSAALPIAKPSLANGDAVWNEISCDTLVVGAGLAGMQAALVSQSRGERVVLVEAKELGGRAQNFPLAAEHVHELAKGISKAPVEVHQHSLCVGFYDSARLAMCIGNERNHLISFDKLIVATGAYDRILTVPGNDLPGIVGVRGLEALVAQNGIPDDARLGIFGWPEETAQALASLESASLNASWIAGRRGLPSFEGRTYKKVKLRKITGSKQVTGVEFSDGQAAKCDVLVLGFSQPSYEIQLHAGQVADTVSSLPVIQPSGRSLVPMLVVGEAAGSTNPIDARKHANDAAMDWYSGKHCDVKAREHGAPVEEFHPDSFVCFCEDVRVSDIQDTIDDGFACVELIKRRTGAATGPCQGKLCHAQILACAIDKGVPIELPTMRPFGRPIPLHKFTGRSDV